MFIPLSAAAVSHIAKQKMGNATSIFNLMRNIGGSAGIALMTTFLARRSQVHHNHLVARVTPYDASTQEMFRQFQRYFISIGSDATTATQRTWAALDGMVQRHAAMIAFNEAFWVNAAIFVAMIPFAALLANPHARRSKQKAAQPKEFPPENAVEPQPEKVPEMAFH
jgi:DHA2 family multidrug resistance protein